MNIKDLLQPKNARLLILCVALIILGRSVYYLVFDTPLALFDESQSQVPIDRLFDIQVPMALMTIFWPVVFAICNSLHKNLRINREAFFFVLIVHATSCTLAAFIILAQPHTSIPGGLYPQGEIPKIGVVISVLALTLVSTLISSILYLRGRSLFEAEAN
ncbi:hypothetical protein [Microbulbifer zhoushanensis]|uniref:hypothetical protein n=1 Tax=Microbulbifer TaxID=48073 RepID=UPI001F4349C2|nr:hypothetical protein [Microbulbifer zhoushanensis]